MNSAKKQEYKKPEVTELSSAISTEGMAKGGNSMENGSSDMGTTPS